ncbi:MAG: hypothetical protein ABWX92_03130 [Mycetocola sp.]
MTQPAEPTDLKPDPALHVSMGAARGYSHSLTRFAVIGFLVMVGALAWGFVATAIDLSSGYSYVTQGWAKVPQIMRDRVPGYSLLPVVAAPTSLLVALLMIYVGGRVWWGERRWTVAHLLFVIGVTWASFGLLTLQIDFAAEEINPAGGSSSFGSMTVAAGWAAIITSAAMLVRLRKPAKGRADTPS